MEDTRLRVNKRSAAMSGIALKRTNMNLEQPALRQMTLATDEINGINLSQGTCLLPTPRPVAEAIANVTLRGAETDAHTGESPEFLTQYSPAAGIPKLRSALALKLQEFNQIPCTEGQVAVTSGSNGAFEAVCTTFLEPGDEVVIPSPHYPYHVNAVKARKAIPISVPLLPPQWLIDLDALDRAISHKTKFVLICNPGNPTGKTYTREELLAIGELCRNRKIFCVTDEVYERITFDNRRHISMASLDGLIDSTITMGSFSKTFCMTGLRVGYIVAPDDVFDHIRTALDRIYICAPTNNQHGVLAGLTELGPDHYDQQLRDYKRKRRILCDALQACGFSVYEPQGAYYVVAGTASKYPGIPSELAAFRLLREAGVGAVPASDFLGTDVKGDAGRSNFLRFCFAMPDERLRQAAIRLREADGTTRYDLGPLGRKLESDAMSASSLMANAM
jgi:aminotransferase